ncbi:MAG: hypothetical protein ACE15B_14290 [Bryobacteraceae bacterium]
MLEEDEICCAEVRYTWRCRSCSKVDTGSAIPYGKCFLCGGELEVIPNRELGDSMRYHAIHDAVQFEVDVAHFFKRARERAKTPEQGIVLERLYEAGVDHLHDLEEKYHASVEPEMEQLASDEEKLLSDWPLKGIQVKEDAGVADLYQVALEVERRAREHFGQLASEFPAGLENELCREVAAEEDEHVAMLETELEQIAPPRKSDGP